MTRVVCFHADSLKPETVNSLSLFAPVHEFADCSADDYAYWREFKARWASGEDLVTIEQDNEIDAGVLAEFDACPEQWCTFAYVVTNRLGVTGRATESLGCTRFRKELQARVKTRHISQDDYRHWGQIAPRVSVTLIRYGYRVHVHERLLKHHHDPDEYGERIRVAREARERNKGTQEYRDALLMPAPRPNYWDTQRGSPSHA